LQLSINHTSFPGLTTRRACARRGRFAIFQVAMPFTIYKRHFSYSKSRNFIPNFLFQQELLLFSPKNVIQNDYHEEKKEHEGLCHSREVGNP
jgi:hypothetical protein